MLSQAAPTPGTHSGGVALNPKPQTPNPKLSGPKGVECHGNPRAHDGLDEADVSPDVGGPIPGPGSYVGTMYLCMYVYIYIYVYIKHILYMLHICIYVWIYSEVLCQNCAKAELGFNIAPQFPGFLLFEDLALGVYGLPTLKFHS